MTLRPHAIICWTLVILITTPLTAAEYHVAADAAPGGDGSISHPFQTIQAAADAAGAGDTVLIRDGTYRETVRPPRGGVADDQRLVFRAADGARPLISGCESIASIAAGTWQRQPGDDPIWTIDLADGFVSSLNQAEQVFVDGAMLHLARYPAIAPGRDWLTPGYVDDYRPGYLKVSETFEASETILEVGTDTPWGPVGKGKATRFRIGCDTLVGSHSRDDLIGATLWLKSEEHQSWGFGHIGPVLDYDPATGEFEAILFVQGFIFQATQARTLAVGTPFYLIDHRALLTSPGSYWLDEDTRQLSVWLPDGGDPDDHLIELKRRDYAFDLSERSFITIEGLRIHAATITTDTAYGTGAGNGAWVAEDRGWYGGAAGNATASNIHIRDCSITHPSHFWGTSGDAHRQWTQSSGVMLVGSDHVLEDCHIAYSAGNGVSIYGYGHRVINNLIHDINYAGAHTSGIQLNNGSIGGTVHTTAEIAHNTILRCGWDGIGGGRVHRSPEFPSRIHHNRIDAVGLIGKDVGGIDMRPSKESLGFLRVDHNWVSNVWAALGNGIYFDFNVDFQVDYNLVTDGNVGIHLNGPDGALVYHNTVLTRNGIGGNDNNTNWGRWANSRVYNNLATGGIIDDAPGAGFQASHNLAEVDASDLLQDPPLDVALRSDASSAIDSGLVINGINDAAVGAPDIGTAERGAADERWWQEVGSDIAAVAAPPSDLTVVGASGNGQVTLRWQDNADNESGYLVERVQRNYLHGNGDWQTTTVARLPADTTSFTDSISGRVDYQRYRVRAVESPASPITALWAGRTHQLTTTFEAGQGFALGALDGQQDWYNLDNSTGIGRADAADLYRVVDDGAGGRRLLLTGDGAINAAGGDYIVQFGNLEQADADYDHGIGELRFAFTIGCLELVPGDSAPAAEIRLGGLTWSWQVPEHIGRPMVSFRLLRDGSMFIDGWRSLGSIGSDPAAGIRVEAIIDQAAGQIRWLVDGDERLSHTLTVKPVVSALFTVAAGVADQAQAVWLDDLLVDGSGGSGPTNLPPTIADLTADPALVTGTQTTLRTTATDPDGDLLSYRWTVLEAPTGGDVTLGDTATVTATFNKAGSYRIGLTVEDGRGGTATDTVTVEVAQSAGGLQVTP